MKKTTDEQLQAAAEKLCEAVNQWYENADRDEKAWLHDAALPIWKAVREYRKALEN